MDRDSLARTALMLVLLLWFGCVSFSDGAFRQVEGRFFDDRLVGKIVDGETSEDTILEWFGEPESRSVSESGARLLRYYSVRTRRSVERRIFCRRSYEQTVAQELNVTTSSGLVIAHHYDVKISEAVGASRGPAAAAPSPRTPTTSYQSRCQVFRKGASHQCARSGPGCPVLAC